MIPYAYNVKGNAFLKTLTTGTVPVTGSVAANLELNTGKFVAKTTLNDTTAQLKALRALPVVATIGFGEIGSTTGTLKDLTLVANTNQLIRIKAAKVFGINLVTKTCTTSKPAAITLKSAAGKFTPISGGTLTGTFTIAPLVNCGGLGSLVSGLTAGGGNIISVNLTKK